MYEGMTAADESFSKANHNTFFHTSQSRAVTLRTYTFSPRMLLVMAFTAKEGAGALTLLS
jgi:hypothetical protein